MFLKSPTTLVCFLSYCTPYWAPWRCPLVVLFCQWTHDDPLSLFRWRPSCRRNWRRSTSICRKRSVSTCSWSSRTRVCRRTPSSHPFPTTAAPAPVRVQARPPTAPRPPTLRRQIGRSGIGARTLARSRWTIPIPRLLPSYQRQRCRSVKLTRFVQCKKEMQTFNWGL